jgi:hypothetical protein
MMKNRLPYSQMVLGLDKLFFGDRLDNIEDAENRIETIDAYMEACGWSWDDMLNYNEAETISTSVSN